MKYHEILKKGNKSLAIKNSNLDCELILSKILNKTREEILTNLNDKIKDAQAETQLENTIDPFLLAEEKKLLGFSDDLRRFKFFN